MRSTPPRVVAVVAAIGFAVVAWLTVSSPNRSSGPDLGEAVVLTATTTTVPSPATDPKTSASVAVTSSQPGSSTPPADSVPPVTHPPVVTPPTSGVGPGASIVTPTTICDAGDQDDDLGDADVDDDDDPCG